MARQLAKDLARGGSPSALHVGAMPPKLDPLMRAAEVRAAFGNLAPATFYDWIKLGIIPAGQRIDPRSDIPFWRQSVIKAILGRVQVAEDAAIEAQQHAPEAA